MQKIKLNQLKVSSFQTSEELKGGNGYQVLLYATPTIQQTIEDYEKKKKEDLDNWKTCTG